MPRFPRCATGSDGLAGSALMFADSVLRGVGQVMFQNNRLAGALFLAGVFWNSALAGAAALLGTAVATAAALLLGAGREEVRAGLYGFNGALVGIALLYFLEPGALTWACAVLAAAGSTVLMAALFAFLERWRIPPLTAPFVCTALCFFLATARLGRLHPTALLPGATLPGAATVEGVVDLATIAAGLFNGIGQVFFQESVVSGALFAAGLLVASRLACAAALTGSLVGLLVAWATGAAEPAIRAGVFGFNGVLVAIALGDAFLAPGRGRVAFTLLALLVTPFVSAATAATLAPFGLPALTLPFVLVTWVFLFASRTLVRVAPAAP